MKSKLRKLSAGLAFFSLLGLSCQFRDCHRAPLTLIEKGDSDCIVVYDESAPAEKFAVKELLEIVKGTTGVELKTADLNSLKAKEAKKRIIVGKNKLTETLLEDSVLKSLRAEESLVTSRGNDLILTGGDDWGMIYAAYDFVENEAGYRCYAPYPGGERFIKTDRLVYSGNETRQKPAFPGFRICYTSPMMFRSNIPAFAKFSFRNRGTQLDWEKYGTGSSFANNIGLMEKYKLHVPGHALFYYVPPNDTTWYFWKTSGNGGESEGLKGSFKEHPEYFTMDKAGKRVDNAQLCFSNPELRKLFTERFIEAVKVKGPGVYMVGSNDFHGGTYCFCPECLKLQKKYNCTGGPLWDYILELCAILEKGYPDVYVTSLAYKGVKQTEIAPDNIAFPGNFICDAAFLNSCKTLKETTPVKFANGETVNNFDKFENLKKWHGITKHVSFWFYGGSAPYQVYERLQKELKELHEAGVESVGSCGLGSMEFGDITTYLYFRLLINPDLNAKAIVKEFAEFKYGAAAPSMLAIIDELEQMRRDNLDIRANQMFCDDTYERMTFIKPEQIIRWRNTFDEMLKLLKDDPVRARNVRIARTALDCWTIILISKIRGEFPEERIDVREILERGLESADEAEKAKMTDPHDSAAKRVMNDMSLYANLKDDSIPEDLRGYPKDKVIRHLPVQPQRWAAKNASLTKDPDAATGWTMKEKIKNSEHCKDGVKFEFYDAFERKWANTGAIKKTDIVPNRYKLYKLFTSYLPSRCRLVFCGLWGNSLDIEQLGRYYDPSYHQRQYEFWANMKLEGPLFDPDSKEQDSYVSCDQIFLVNMGMKE